jgi:hypothetical protein
MPSPVTMKAIGDWNNQMDIPLANALAASIELAGRNGRKAVAGAIVMMAQTARKLTAQSKQKRPVKSDQFGKYFEREKTGDLQRVYAFLWKRGGDKTNPWVQANNTFEDARVIKNRGLAKRSWMWGIRELNKAAANERKPIAGVTDLREIIGRECGMVLTNRLSYIMNAAPADVEAQAARSASNRIMATAAKAMERKYGMTIPRLAASRAKRAQKTLAQAYVEGGS